ncbi:MAG: hypothetical protein HC828_15850 [Blastochloris sp.]|nr:hypothetical protein [Blastochloris sp.]
MKRAAGVGVFQPLSRGRGVSVAVGGGTGVDVAAVPLGLVGAGLLQREEPLPADAVLLPMRHVSVCPLAKFTLKGEDG